MFGLQGYRFFQSSFDQMKGNGLICKPRFLGTVITYAGYLYFFAMMSIMFTKHSRFADLKRKLDVVKTKKSKLITIF
jgi:hypothetical protein